MTGTWKVSTDSLKRNEAERLSDRLVMLLGGGDTVVSVHEKRPSEDGWCVDVYFQDAVPDAVELESLFRTRAITCEALPETDWVGLSQSRLAPVGAGRFFVHGEHDRGRRPAGGVGVEIQAGQAFGTGRHGTTRGCLMALDCLLKRRRPANALDVGCGSAVLAIAFALASKRPALASDVDPVAVDVARSNVRRNLAGPLVRAVLADGVTGRAFADCAPSQLVMANILAGPLTDMKASLAAAVAPGGCLILSGVTHVQESRLVGCYAPFGLKLRRLWRLDGWSTLLLSRRPV